MVVVVVVVVPMPFEEFLSSVLREISGKLVLPVFKHLGRLL